MDEKKYVLTEELANEEFEKWAEAMDIDVEESGGEDKDGDSLLRSGKKSVVKALMRGSMVLNDDGNLEYTLSSHNRAELCGEKLVLGMPPASVYAFGKGNAGEAIFAFVSGMTGKDKGFLSKISYADFKVLQAVAGLFLKG